MKRGTPLGGVLVYMPGTRESRGPLTDPVIAKMAARHRKTPAQVVHFALTAEDVAAIDALDMGVRGGPDPATLSLETYPKIVDNSDR